ncbi:TonB-dependent siderophore receptor [Lusitaniella coriacea LEGE 07157]|uniref:TonB-dependent siderophore receptor n=1 Tax=Lusitaniella coriacea LEGE 07157 TaxID=945747 RepID=A0A8J7E034_9CYAN|nr:TonB-dependent siderophore receptor [Lusitaniella coriacea]MBE9118006.1 TonB-dependent siderophore receptor [Lusitaniella coriacea LEGE 07157]
MKSSIFALGAIAPLITALMLLSGQSAKAIEDAIAPPAEIPLLPESEKRIPSRESQVQPTTEIPSWSALNRPATTVDEWLVQIAQASAIQITGVQLDSTETGIELLLETLDELETPETSVSGNTLTAEIPNAVLALPDGDEFSALEPTVGVARINVTNLPGNRVRVVITGTDAPPAVDIRTGISGLVLGISSEEIEIVVTQQQSGERYLVPNATAGTRTDTPIIDTPQSIQVVPQRVLEDQQIIRVDEALRNVSGISGRFGTFGTGENIAIRGFTSNGFDSGPIVRNGFRVTNLLGTQETANIERIEVLKGPSSVLYGQIEPGGIINLVTKQPLSEPFYELKLQAGSSGLIRPSVDLTGPLTEDASLRYRLNVAYQREDGFRNFETETRRFFIAPVLSWDISDRTTLTLLLEYVDEKDPHDPGIPALDEGVFDVPRDRITTHPDSFVTNRSLTLGYDLKHQLDEGWTLNHGFRYVSQDYAILSLLPLSVDETAGTVFRAPASREYYSSDYSVQTNIVGEFATGTIAHTLLFGVDLNFNRFDDRFTKIDFPVGSSLNLSNPVFGAFPGSSFENATAFPDFDTEADRVGVFLQDQINFSDNFIVLASLRYDSVDFRNLFDETSRSDSAWSPRLGVVYKPTENLSLYASYSQSFNPNFGTDVNGNSFEPQKSTGYEIGIKAELLDGSLQATLAYFDITKENVTTADPNNQFFSVATGEQRSQGVELDIAGEILPGWNIIANYAYTDARITKDNTIPEGNRLFNAPYHGAGLWTTYEIQSGDLQGLGFGVGVNYVGDRAGDLANSFKVGDYFLTNAALFYERDNWRLGLNFNNLFNTNYIISTNERSFGNTVGAPFSVVGSISVQF